jgi:hypothetical protein
MLHSTTAGYDQPMAQRLRHTASWLRDRLEDVAAVILGDTWRTKPPPKDPRNGL